jgi:molybdopterin-guanine dinucleotide biosynthesis protein A
MLLTNTIRAGGVILCGGQSRRMGVPKASLPFGGELMLPRVYRLLREVVQPIVVVSSREQSLPELPAEAMLVYDERPHRGPLEGLAAGLRALAPVCELAYVTSCDVPLLQPAFVRQLLSLVDDFAVVAPHEAEFCHPLSAVYRTSLVPTIAALLADDQLRPTGLLQQVRTRFVPVDDLRPSDPTLQTLRNLNTPADYLAALQEAGLTVETDSSRLLSP